MPIWSSEADLFMSKLVYLFAIFLWFLLII